MDINFFEINWREVCSDLELDYGEVFKEKEKNEHSEFLKSVHETLYLGGVFND